MSHRIANTCSDVMNPATFRRLAREQPLRPYEVLFAHDRWTNRTPELAQVIMTEGWKFGPLPRAPLSPPIAWSTLGASHRSWQFHLHCWDALGPVLAAYDATGDSVYLHFAVSIATDWSQQHRSIDPDASFAWYDMAIGVRAYRLAYILDAAARSDAVSDECLETLLHAVELHRIALGDDANFAAHSNHGFYFAAGQLALARRLGYLEAMHEQHRQAARRVHLLIDTQFTSEGVHREHSPDYQRLVWQTLQGLIDAGLLDRDTFGPRSAVIRNALAWFILPSGKLAMFGDTPERFMTPSDIGASEDRAEDDQSGDILRVFRESGYAIVRDAQSYLAQSACFHSRVHKHADDLSFIWHERGCDILIDPGRFGYLDPTRRYTRLWRQGFHYSHPSRVYVESTRAHNTVEIDGESHLRRGVQPYGSAIERFGCIDGVHYIETHVRHRRTLRHARVLLYRMNQWLLVYDWLWDNARARHDFTQWFQFAPELDVTVNTGQGRVTLPRANERLHVAPLLDGELSEPVHGETSPRLQGWMSRVDNELTPAWSLAQRVTRAADARFAMVMSFGSDSIIPITAHASTSGREANFAWQHDEQIIELSMQRPQHGPFALQCSQHPIGKR